MEVLKQKIPDTNRSFFKQNPIPPESNKTKIFIAYCRCSTIMQSLGDSINVQEKMIVDYCKNKNFYLYLIYSDEGISGAKDREDRPGFDNALNMLYNLRQNKFKCSLITIHQDRLYRRISKITTLHEDFVEKGIGMYFISMHCDVTKDKKLEFQISALVADNERSLISERVKNNIAYRKDRGVLKTKVKFGETKNHNTQEPHFVNEKEQEIIEYIRALRTENPKCKVNYIIELLDEKYPATLFKGKTKWFPTQIHRIIAHNNIPGENQRYILSKKNKNIESEDD